MSNFRSPLLDSSSPLSNQGQTSYASTETKDNKDDDQSIIHVKIVADHDKCCDDKETARKIIRYAIDLSKKLNAGKNKNKIKPKITLAFGTVAQSACRDVAIAKMFIMGSRFITYKEIYEEVLSKQEEVLHREIEVEFCKIMLADFFHHLPAGYTYDKLLKLIKEEHAEFDNDPNTTLTQVVVSSVYPIGLNSLSEGNCDSCSRDSVDQKEISSTLDSKELTYSARLFPCINLDLSKFDLAYFHTHTAENNTVILFFDDSINIINTLTYIFSHSKLVPEKNTLMFVQCKDKTLISCKKIDGTGHKDANIHDTLVQHWRKNLRCSKERGKTSLYMPARKDFNAFLTRRGIPVADTNCCSCLPRFCC